MSYELDILREGGICSAGTRMMLELAEFSRWESEIGSLSKKFKKVGLDAKMHKT
jgi:hypothetical protein